MTRATQAADFPVYFHYMLLSFVAALALAAAQSGDSLAVPVGSLVPVRFLSPIKSGSTRRGWTVEVQTMADVVAGRCVAIPAYTQILGIVDESLAGWFFRHRGRLHLNFQIVQTGPADWALLTAVVDDIEWLALNLVDSSGLIRPAQHSTGHRLLGGSSRFAVEERILTPLTGAVAAPVAVAGTGAGFVARGPRVEIREGDEATLRLTSPFRLAADGPCRTVLPLSDSVTTPGLDLSSLPPRTTGGNGAPADVINLLILGRRTDLERAFVEAAWLEASAGGLRSRVGAAGAVVLGKSNKRGPVSPQRLFGRTEDLAFERQGLNARQRHHVRIWAVDSNETIWVGAANEDVGVYVTVAKPRITHRIDSRIDGERDLLSRELEASGCAVREGFVRIPGCPLSGQNSSGEGFVTDTRVAVVRLRACRSPP